MKVETLKTIQAFIGSTSKASAAKVHSTVLPAAAKAAGEAAPDIREAALGVLVAFAMKAGSASVLSKVSTAWRSSECLSSSAEACLANALHLGQACW